MPVFKMIYGRIIGNDGMSIRYQDVAEYSSETLMKPPLVDSGLTEIISFFEHLISINDSLIIF